MDVDYEILNYLLQPEIVGGVTTHFGKHITDSLLDHIGKKESRSSQMDTLKAWVKTFKARIETSKARTEALLVRAKRYKRKTNNEATSVDIMILA